MMKKTNEKKVLHKVKKRWIVLGTALFALAGAGAYPETANADTSANHSLTQTTTTSSADDQSSAGSTVTTSSTSASGSTTSISNADTSSTSTTTQSSGSPSSTSVTSDSNSDNSLASSSSATTTVQDNVVLYRDGDTTSNASDRPNGTSATNLSLVDSEPSVDSLSTSMINSSSGNSYSVGLSITGNVSATYRGVIDTKTYSVQFANDDDGNSPFTGISNVYQHIILSGGSEESSSADSNMYNFNPNINSNDILVTKSDGTKVSSATQAIFSNGPYDSEYNNKFYAGDKIWWTFDLTSNKDFKGYPSTNTVKYAIVPYNNYGYQTATPVEIKFIDSNTNQPIKSSEWVTGDNIYPDNTFGNININENMININGYSYNGLENAENINIIENATNSITFSGRFGYFNANDVTLKYTANPVSGTIKYVDSTNNSEIASEASLSGSVGSSYSTQSVVDSLTNQGYSLVNNAPSTSITLNSSNNDYTFKFTHKTSDASQSKNFTRNINFVDSATNSEIPSQSSVSQTVTYSRSGTYDEVTKQTSYGNWAATNKGSFAEYAAPSIAGYDNPNPTSVPASSVNSDDSNTTTSATIAYTKTSSSATPFSSSATPNPSSSIASSSQAPVSASSSYIFVSSSASSTSTASSSSAPIIVASVATKMYNNETQLIKSGNQILIYVEPRYANNTGIASTNDSYVVNIQNADGTVSHKQLVTLDQYNAMLIASGKAPYTPEDLQQAYNDSKNNHGILDNDVHKTTFDARTVQKGNDTFIFTGNGKKANGDFKRPKDGKLVSTKGKKNHPHKGNKHSFKNKKKQIKNKRNHMKTNHHHAKKNHSHHKK